MSMTDSEISSATNRPLIAVTGAAGLVGGYLVQYLVAKGYPVTAIIRTPGSPSYLLDCVKNSDGKAEIRIADVNDEQSLLSAFRDARVVVHAAGNVNPYGSRDEIFRTNVEGTKTVVKAARLSHVQQVIHVSSLSVITGQGDQFDVDESAPLRYCGENYADSKVAAEEAILQEMKMPGISLTVVRPGFIYGPHEKTWMPRLIESIRTSKAALIDGGLKETNVINVENLCRAIEGAILREVAFGQTYNLTDGEKVSKKMLFDTISGALGLPPVKKVIPSAVARPFCNLISSVAPILPVGTQQKLARYSRAAFRLVGVNQGFSIAKAEAQLGYRDRVPFSEGMRAALTAFESSDKPPSSSDGAVRYAAVGNQKS
jgi:nucleoside-diphosphate-sugar epimerase